MRTSSVSRPVVLLVVSAFLCAGGWSARGDDVVFARHLSLSPDGQTLAFSWAGDIWTVSAAGGVAQRLTVHPSHESHPVWSHGGEQIAFTSQRHGAANVFVMNVDGTDIRRLTFDDRAATVTDWSLDDQYVYYHSACEGQVYWEPKVYRVPVAGGQPWRAMDCFAAGARVGPQGQHLAFVRGGSKWWRRGYRGSANHDIWLYDIQSGAFRQFTDFDGTDRQPCWDRTGGCLYYLSERGGNLNVWFQALAGDEPFQLTNFDGDDVRDLTVSYDGRTMAFTYWDKVYVIDLPLGEPEEITITAASDAPLHDVEWRTFRNGAEEAEISPDGDEIALVVHGELFVIRTEDDKPTRRVTHSPYRDHDVIWSPDGKALFFVSDRIGVEQIFRVTSAEEPAKPLADSLRFNVEQVTEGADPNRHPQLSPDGKSLAYVRLRGDLIVRDLKTGDERVLLESWNTPSYQWSPDSKQIAYAVEDIEHNPDIWVVPADGSSPAVNISQHPDDDGSPQWSHDGRLLAFRSARHGFDTDLYVAVLAPALEELSSDERAAYFKDQADKVKKLKPLKSAVASGKIRLAGEPPASQPATAPAAEEETPAEDEEAGEPESKPAAEPRWRTQARKFLKQLLEEPSEPDADEDEGKEKKKEPEKDKKKEAKPEYPVELDTAYRRIRRVTRLPADQGHFAFAPDGSLLVFTSNHTGSTRLYSVKWDGGGLKQIGSSGVGALRWSLTGNRLYYIKSGVPNSCSASGSGAKAYGFRAKMAIDYTAEAAQKFDDGARALGRDFYHPTLKGLDWPALTAHYRELALRTRTVTEFNEIFSMLLGELNGSHLGIMGGGRGGGTFERVGYLGCSFDPAYAGPGLKVMAVTPRSPADREESKLVPGDVLLRVNGQPVGPADPLARALIDAVNDLVIVEYLPSPDREAEATSTQPATAPAEEAEAEADVAVEPEPQKVVIRPISYGTLDRLLYDAWVEQNRRYVAEHSDGRLGYCHIESMGAPSFELFERDLYAAAHGRDGLIIDVRNNGGGWTADWVLAVLTVQRHAFTVPRGAEQHGYPQDRLIFYSWTKPTTMMCNQYSYSNAEIVSHAFKTLKRGPLVGMTTFGAVISTGAHRLIDGTYVRIPGRGWYTLPDGTDMELHGAVPDILVPRGPADEVAGRQPQLDAAIQATLERVAAENDQP